MGDTEKNNDFFFQLSILCQAFTRWYSRVCIYQALTPKTFFINENICLSLFYCINEESYSHLFQGRFKFSNEI